MSDEHSIEVPSVLNDFVAKELAKDRDPNIHGTDPQHFPNPNYQGLDAFVIDFVKKREVILDTVKAQQALIPQPPDITVQMEESEVHAKVGESNQKYADGALRRETLNSFLNHPLILHDFATGRGRTVEGGHGLGPALIVGSGPTLDDAHDLIRGWKGGLFCSTSQGITMLALGKRDFYMIAVDVKTESDELMPLDEWQGKGVKIITHPGIDPEIIQAWRWEKRYFRIIVHQMPLYTEIQPIAYPMITTTMYVYGCAVSAQLMLASMMGYNPLFMVGCDFGYPREQARFRQYTKVDGEWVLGAATPARYLLHPRVRYRNDCMTDHFQAYYKQTFFNAWRLSLADVFIVGHGGGIYEVPSIEPAELISRNGDMPRDRYLSNKDKTDICERYLIKYGTYTFEFPNGQVEYVVFEHPETEIPLYIEAMNKIFADRKLPGVLLLGEERARFDYLLNDEAWERKEKRWQWAIKSPQLPTETPSELPSASA